MSTGDPYGILGGLDMAALSATLKQPRQIQAAAQPRDGECSCGERLQTCIGGFKQVCTGCSCIVDVESTDDDARALPTSTRLTIVGPNSSQLQPDLYRSGVGTTHEQQVKSIFEEYKRFGESYVAAGGRAFPLDACQKAATYYELVRAICVKRSQNKKSIMAQMLTQACFESDFAPEKGEVVKFMQLNGKGIAHGTNFVRQFAADGHMEGVKIDVDPCRPEIMTLFASHGLDGAQYQPLRDAVYAIVKKAISCKIASNSILRSKVAGAAFTVFRRCTNAALLSRKPTAAEFCEKYHIRKNTLNTTVSELEDYHSYFKDIYLEYGLDASPPRKMK